MHHRFTLRPQVSNLLLEKQTKLKAFRSLTHYLELLFNTVCITRKSDCYFFPLKSRNSGFFTLSGTLYNQYNCNRESQKYGTILKSGLSSDLTINSILCPKDSTPRAFKLSSVRRTSLCNKVWWFGINSNIPILSLIVNGVRWINAQSSDPFLSGYDKRSHSN